MDWIKEIEIKDLLTHDTQLIAEHCGMDVLIRLWECVPGLNIYVSTKPLIEAKKRYIRKFYNGSNIKSLAIKLNVSERFVYEAISSATADVKNNVKNGKL